MLKGWAILALSSAQILLAASFDCSKAHSAQEKAVCASTRLSEADDRMATAYERALSLAPAEVKHFVRDDQRAWVKLIPLYCPVQRRNPDEPMQQCLYQQYEERIKELGKLVQRRGGITFVWRTITLTVSEKLGENEYSGDAGAAYEEMPGFGTLSASWPIAVSADPDWEAWNAAVESAAKSILSSSDSPAGTAPREFAAEEWEDDSVDVSLGVDANGMIAAFVDGWWRRGAHPTEASVQLNWLLKERRELRPEDVFHADSGWDAVLQSGCVEYLHKQFPDLSDADYERSNGGAELPDALHEIAVDSRNWRLDEKGISIVFQDYAILPRVLHPGPIFFSWERLRPLLRPQFAIP